MEVLLLDNHDSFTYNIAHIIEENSDVNLRIITSDRIDLKEIAHYDKIIFSPGPDIPAKGNIMEEILASYSDKIPILGICLGLQAIVIYFGGEIIRLDKVTHGRTLLIEQTDNKSRIFDGVPVRFSAGLYHSWIADLNRMPDSLEVTAISMEERVMAIRHNSFNIEAVQFHPESIMTPFGPKMINNWLRG